MFADCFAANTEVAILSIWILRKSSSTRIFLPLPASQWSEISTAAAMCFARSLLLLSCTPKYRYISVTARACCFPSRKDRVAEDATEDLAPAGAGTSKPDAGRFIQRASSIFDIVATAPEPQARSQHPGRVGPSARYGSCALRRPLRNRSGLITNDRALHNPKP